MTWIVSRTEEARGSNPLTSTPQPSSSERRRCVIGGALVVPRAAWGHTGPRPARRGQPNRGAVRCRLGGAAQRVQAVAERGVGLRVQVAVTVEGEAHRGMAGPGGDARSVVEVVADELGPSLRWPTATTTRATRSQDR